MKKLARLLLLTVLAALSLSVFAGANDPQPVDPKPEYPEGRGEFGEGIYWRKDGTTLEISAHGGGRLYIPQMMADDDYNDYSNYADRSGSAGGGSGGHADAFDSTLNPADSYFADVTVVEINGSITKIAGNCFWGFPSLEEICLPRDLREVGHSAFKNCCELKTVELDRPGESVDPDWLEQVEVEKGNDPLLIALGRMEPPVYTGSCGDSLQWTLDCASRVLTISGTGDMETDFGWSGAPWNEHAVWVRSIVVEEGVTSISEHAFNEMPSLETVVIADSVTAMDEYVFYECGRLKEVTLGSGISAIEQCTFYECGALEIVRAPGVTAVKDSAFRDCGKLTTLELGEGLTCVEGFAFTDCKALTSIRLAERLTTLGEYAFNGCEALAGELCIPEGITEIPRAAFSGCESLRTVTIPDSVSVIGNGAFSECENLAEVQLGSGLTAIGWSAFAECTSLTSVTIPDRVTIVDGHAFFGCTSLAEVHFGSGVTTIGKSAFEGCSSLTVAELREGVVSVGDAAFLNTKLQTVTIPASVKEIGLGAFGGAAQERILVAEGNEHFKTVDGVLFTMDGTVLLAAPVGLSGRYDVPEGVVNIGESGFQNCGNLTDVVFPYGVTEIGQMAFSGCGNLTTVAIPVSVATIRYQAFSQYTCKAIKTVYYGGTETQWAEITFYSDNKPLKDAEILFNSEAPVGGVNVTVTVPAGAEVLFGENVYTSVSGIVTIPGVAEGIHTVQVVKPGCLRYTITGVEVKDSAVKLGTIKLLAGDVNGDDMINIVDMGIFRQNFGKSGGSIANAHTDTNGDNMVNIMDMSTFRQNFGKTAAKDCTVVYGA